MANHDFPACGRQSPALGPFRNTEKVNQRNIMNYIIVFGLIAVAVVLAALPFIKKLRHVFCVPEGYAGLLYHHGLYMRRNNAGRHVLWGSGWTMNLIDLRKTSLLVAGQDVLTSDSVSIKINLLVTYQVTDPAKAAHETQHWQNDLSYAVELALGALAKGATSEVLPGQRAELGAQLLARVQPRAVKIGVDILAIEVRDVSRATRENPVRVAWC